MRITVIDPDAVHMPQNVYASVPLINTITAALIKNGFEIETSNPIPDSATVIWTPIPDEPGSFSASITNLTADVF